MKLPQVLRRLLPSHAPAVRPTPSAAYMRGEQLPLFFRWSPALRDASEDVKVAWRLATARSIDAIQNSGWLSGCVEQSAASVVGPGLRLNAKPNAEALGWTQADANQWARRVEARFQLWASNRRSCDAGARFTFGQLQVQAYRHWMATGEILASLPMIDRPGSSFGTKLRLFPAWRMSDRSLAPDLVQGVRVDPASGEPRAYVIKRKTDGWDNETELAAVDGEGRPRIVHIFDGEPDQVRGISPFVAVLKTAKQFDQLADATLTAALIQAIFAAVFKTQAVPEEARAAMISHAEADEEALRADLTTRTKWYQNADFSLGVPGKIIHGYPGDELQFLRSETPNATYESFAKFLLRECSRAGAMTYEEFTGDYQGATFSSVKMGTAVVWPRVVYRRRHIVAPLCTAVYAAFLEEDIESGMTPFPGGVDGFRANREAVTQASWRGPTKPQADDLKAAKAAQTWQEIGVPDAVIFDELGGDVDEWYEQRKREQDRRDELELRDPARAPQAGTPIEDRQDQSG